eukprot:m.70172 g.70172  ORF g.70172 m.70172 type:complete len:187 (+) comp24185_c0_seq1:163-723(+)
MVRLWSLVVAIVLATFMLTDTCFAADIAETDTDVNAIQLDKNDTFLTDKIELQHSDSEDSRQAEKGHTIVVASVSISAAVVLIVILFTVYKFRGMNSSLDTESAQANPVQSHAIAKGVFGDSYKPNQAFEDTMKRETDMPIASPAQTENNNIPALTIHDTTCDDTPENAEARATSAFLEARRKSTR